MTTLELSAGIIEYDDSGGSGPVIVLIHGLLMDSSIWRTVTESLAPDYRCVAPTLPVGAHRIPLSWADLTLSGLAGLLGEFLERLELDDVTLVVNDLGFPLLLAADHHPRSPAAFPAGYGLLCSRPIPRQALDRWFAPARSQAEVRRDLRRYIAAADAASLLNATERLSRFDRPALVIWAPEDRVMPPVHGTRLAALLPQGALVNVDNSYTLMSLDRPDELTRLLREFMSGLQSSS